MPTDDDILGQLDASIDAIKSHREATTKEFEANAARIDETWEALLEAAKKLRNRLANNEKVRYFTISRDELEITVSFRSKTPGGKGNMIAFNRNHPQGKYPGTDAVWVNEPGKPEMRIEEKDTAVQMIIKFCARNLT